MRHRIGILVLNVLGLLLQSGIAFGENPYVILEDGRRVDGLRVTADAEGQIQLHLERGVLTFDKGTRVFMPRPRELDQAMQLMQQQRFAPAVAVLETVVQEFRFLGWDVEAMKLLARAQVGAGRVAEAVAVYERLFAHDPSTKGEADDYLRYLQALETVGEAEKLLTLLGPAIRKSPRRVAAWAQLKRGTLAFEAGDVERAVLDFKRTADYFEDQDSYQAEALFRTAQSLSLLQDARASHYHELLQSRYPGSRFALKSLKP